MRFENQVAIVTGAGRGIGQAIAVRLASEGARVACVSRTEANAGKVADEINARILAVSEDRIAGFRTGVDAYVTKPFDTEEMLAIVSSILNRVQRTSTELARMVQTAKGDEPAVSGAAQPALDEEFTEAEARIVPLIARGLSNKEIAAELQISVRTVEGHISNILSKKGWTSRVEIARYMFERSAGAKS